MPFSSDVFGSERCDFSAYCLLAALDNVHTWFLVELMGCRVQTTFCGCERDRPSCWNERIVPFARIVCVIGVSFLPKLGVLGRRWI